MLTKAEASRSTTAQSAQAQDDDQEVIESSVELQTIASLGAVLLDKRTEAQNWRAQSGIEQDWQEDEEFYQGIDRANPEGESHVGKPLSADGGAENRAVKPAGRSSVFIPITRAYVDAAAARVSDMLLPNDDSPWQLRATPHQQPVMAQPVPNPASVGMAAVSPIPGAVAQVATGMQGAQPAPAGAEPVTSQVQAAMSEEEQKAERATKIITDWHVECQWHAEMRKVIEDAALLGTGVLKGPFPVQRRSFKYERDAATGAYQLVERKEIVPISRRVNPRNLWTDPAGGEDHQAGSYVWELDNIGTRALRDLLDDPTYVRENILRALREGPSGKSGRDRPDNGAWQVDVGATYPLWYFWGDIDKKTMIAAGIPEEDLPEGEPEEVALPAVVIMVNDLVIKVAQAPLDAGGFPYDLFPWQRRPGIPWGKGVARQVRTPQRMLNAAVRAEMDNGGLSSGPIYAIRRDWIIAIDGNDAVLTPRKGFYMTEKAPPTAKIQDAISFTNIQSAIAELERIIDRAMRFAEDATGLPMLMQGQQGEATTTATGMTILNNNGSTVLRRIARTVDDHVTEPHIRRYYYWLLANQGNDDAKGDFQIDARGSTYLVDREIQAQQLNALYPMFAQHPDVHIGRLAEEVAQANRLNYKRIMLTDAEKAEKAKTPPPEAPQVQVARIREEHTDRRHAADLEHKGKVDSANLQLEFELGLAGLEQKGQISQDNIKAMLAATLAKLQAQSGDKAADRAAEPAEPPGKAPAGEGFSK
jgi:hypothetical protein